MTKLREAGYTKPATTLEDGVRQAITVERSRLQQEE